MLALAVLFFAGSVPTVSAYDNDTHFWLTYYLARQAGYTQIQATQIASADISVDLDHDTRPVTPSPTDIGQALHYFNTMQRIHSEMHALPWEDAVEPDPDKREDWSPYPISDPSLRERSNSFVSIRKKDYWRQVWRDGQNPGAFLHFLQDSYAHQYFMGLIGHAGYDGVDFISTDKSKAKEMVRMTLRYLLAFRTRSASPSGDVNAPDAEAIDVDARLGSQAMSDVDAMVEALAACNFMANRSANAVTIRWDIIWPAAAKRMFKFSFAQLARTLWRQRNLTFSPNSFFARREVIRALNLTDASGIPDIWLYDLNSDGTPNVRQTLKYFAYKANQPTLPSAMTRSGYEDINKELKISSAKCLPFALVADTQTEMTCK